MFVKMSTYNRLTDVSVFFYTKQTSVFSISSTSFGETKRKPGKNKGEDMSINIDQAKRGLNYQLER